MPVSSPCELRASAGRRLYAFWEAVLEAAAAVAAAVAELSALPGLLMSSALPGLLIALLGFKPHVATGLSQSMLFGGGLAALRSPCTVSAHGRNLHP